MYFYESHLGGLYKSEKPIADDALFCDECFDSDTYLGEASNAKELRRVLKNNHIYKIYLQRYCEDFIKECFGNVRSE